ncbi:MAG TPA: MFS transporter, partial [Thermoanaerobaculia bacterium]|nr:MFS transporter [Thermoanaerobaculia bacterium]
MATSTAVRQQPLHATVLNLAVIVAALGYFVDIYDLLLFAIVRQPSLAGLGVPADALLATGAHLLNWQMGGMLLGGILWGVLGDKRGRLSVLFGSILLYSLANLANGAVHSLGAYAACRLIAGIGLAGELGAGITLVSEVMTREHRGYGTSLVSGFGILGAVVAGLVGRMFDWRIAYYVGGALGLVLLILRIGAYESGMFDQVKSATV